MIQCIIFKFRKWHSCNYEWYRLYRSYENCRRPGVAILDMQMSKVPIISGYAHLSNQSFVSRRSIWYVDLYYNAKTYEIQFSCEVVLVVWKHSSFIYYLIMKNIAINNLFIKDNFTPKELNAYKTIQFKYHTIKFMIQQKTTSIKRQ